MALTAECVLRPNPDVIHTTLYNREAVLLHLPTTAYFSLNPTGARIWRLIGEGLSLGEIATKMIAEYDVGAAEAKSSVLALAESLIRADLSSVVSNGAGHR